MDNLQYEMERIINEYGHHVVLRHYDYSSKNGTDDKYKTKGYSYSDSVCKVRINGHHDGDILEQRSVYIKAGVALHRGDLIIEKQYDGPAMADESAFMALSDRAVYKIEDIVRYRWRQGQHVLYKVTIMPHLIRSSSD